MKAIALALFATLIAASGQLLLKAGMSQVGPVSGVDLSTLVPFVVKVFSTPLILIAIPVYVAGFLTWLVVLSELDLSYAYSFLAITYVLVPVLSRLFLGEQVPAVRWMGIAVICVGLIIVGRAQ
jgi:multidrug transporter EmrE-like cation transporter